MTAKINKVVLAYSGGLDTSVILKWLIETYNCEVVTFSAAIGQEDDLEEIKENAHKTGASKAHIEDLTEEFVRDYVFAAFRATFEEASDADLVLEVVDASSPEHDEHLSTTDQLLAKLGLDTIPRLIVHNKVDLLAPKEREALEQQTQAVAISAIDRRTTVRLLERIASRLNNGVNPLPAEVEPILSTSNPCSE